MDAAPPAVPADANAVAAAPLAVPADVNASTTDDAVADVACAVAVHACVVAVVAIAFAFAVFLQYHLPSLLYLLLFLLTVFMVQRLSICFHLV